MACCEAHRPCSSRQYLPSFPAFWTWPSEAAELWAFSLFWTPECHRHRTMRPRSLSMKPAYNQFYNIASAVLLQIIGIFFFFFFDLKIWDGRNPLKDFKGHFGIKFLMNLKSLNGTITKAPFPAVNSKRTSTSKLTSAVGKTECERVSRRKSIESNAARKIPSKRHREALHTPAWRVYKLRHFLLRANKKGLSAVARRDFKSLIIAGDQLHCSSDT